MRSVLLPLSFLLTCSCSYPDEADPRPGSTPTFALASTTPMAGQVDVARDTAFAFAFDTPPDVSTVHNGTVRLFSGYIETIGSRRVDLLRSRIEFRPAQLLRPDLRHQVYLGGGLRGLNGSQLGERVVFDFSTGRGVAGTSPYVPPRVTATDLHPLFAARCINCHGGAGRVGVDLSSPSRAVSTMVNVQAMARPLSRVEAGRHAASYLMYKMLDRGGIDGFPMPPDGPRLGADALRRVADWIDGGARR